MAKTPMMQQYDDAKSACGDAVLLFRMGDFYELFFEDAKLVARVLGLTLTSRDKGENPIPMAGFPHHQLDGYLAKLIAAGYRCAVCEQMEDPKLAKGLVKREVTRIVSPGTVTDDLLLDPKEANFLLAVCEDAGRSAAAAGRLGLAWADLSTGRFLATTIEQERLADQLARISPSEVLLVEGSPLAAAMRAKGGDVGRGRRMMLTTRPAWSFGFDEANRALESHFQLHGLSGLGFEEDDAVAIRACGGLLAYLQETQKHSLSHLDHPLPWRRSRTLEIDEATRRSLEITRTLREARREGSLLSVLDRCVTPMGSRLLGDWLANPSTDRERIESRLEAVGFAVSHGDWCDAVRGRLQGIYEVPRLLSRIVAGRATPRDLSFVARTLGSLPEIGQLLQQAEAVWLKELGARFDLAEDVRSVLDLALEEECPIQPREGGFIRAGYSPELDELREMAHGGKRWIAGYQAKIIEETGIANLKVGFNKVFGYYIEATQSQSTKIPANFIRKQTIKNAERYITPELKEYEERVLTADERAKTLEYELFCDLRQRVHDATTRLQGTADVLAALDVVTALADLARRRGYCRPEIVEEPILEIVDGRHPVLDLTEAEGTFVPNDVSMGGEAGIVMLITGPNMAGKSTYIRQVALLTLMAQIGSFIPARSAKIGLADRIFARVGASDELSRGQSTFMVEMTETAALVSPQTACSSAPRWPT